MTKIGKTMITVKGKIHPVEIHYNRERKFFYRGVPDEGYRTHVVQEP